MKNLNYVVRLVQLDLQSYSTHLVPRILQYCIDAYKQELKFKTSKSVKVAYLAMNDVNNAAWPNDYEYYTKVAINWCGRLVTLSLNNNIPLQRKYDDCGIATLDQVVANPDCCNNYDYGYFYSPHYRNGQYVGEMYSMGGGFNEAGYFREDAELRQFQFYNVPRTEVVLEYVADEDTTGATMIPLHIVEAIRRYAHWKMVEYDKSIPLALKQRAQDQFRFAMTELKYLTWAWTASDFMDACWAGMKSAPKR